MTTYTYVAKGVYKTSYQGVDGPSSVRFSGVGITEQGGAYQISGIVDRLGVVGVYRVALFDRGDGRYIRETLSDAQGEYTFTQLAYRPNGYFVIAFDHSGSPLNAAIADLITPEPLS